jgi:hypothetical protein
MASVGEVCCGAVFVLAVSSGICSFGVNSTKIANWGQRAGDFSHQLEVISVKRSNIGRFTLLAQVIGAFAICCAVPPRKASVSARVERSGSCGVKDDARGFACLNSSLSA